METARSLNRSYFPRWPSHVDLELTNRCNLSCRSCWLHGENGVGDRYGGTELQTGEVLRLIDQVAPHGPSLYFGGAEPLLRGDFLTIVAYAKSYGLNVAFTTNGTLMTPEVSEALVAARVDRINVSVDGPEQVHDRLRGQGNFSRTIANLCGLLDCRQEQHAERPLVNVNITVNPACVGRLGETITLLRDLTKDRVDCYRIHHLWVLSAHELQLHRAAVSQTLACYAPGAGSHHLSITRELDLDALCDETSRLRGASKVASLPDVWGEQVREFYAEGAPDAGKCRSPLHSVLIKPDGEVRFCPDEWIDDYALGNIREAALRSIWRGRRARRFRRVVVTRGCFPGCKRCSWLR